LPLGDKRSENDREWNEGLAASKPLFYNENLFSYSSQYQRSVMR